MAENKKLPLSIFELVVYILAGLMGLGGLTYLVLGFIVVDIAAHDSALTKANNSIQASSGMGFLYQGLLVLAIAVVVAVVVLLIHAKTADREYEKQQRRVQARNNRRKTSEDENVVEVESEPAE